MNNKDGIRMIQDIIRVFPRKTKWTPTDELAFVGDPPLFIPPEIPVRISCTFTWDRQEALRLQKSWKRFYSDVQVGGPAFDDAGDEFVPGRFIKEGVTITSRGCPFSCPWCFVPGREGDLRELPIMPGHIIQDNNLLACSKDHIQRVVEMLKNQKSIKLMGLDKRLFTNNHLELFRDLSIAEYWFSCDSDEELSRFADIANLLFDEPQNKKRCYCLIGFPGDYPEKAEKRLKRVFECDFLPFAQLYLSMDSDKPKNQPRIWRDLARKWSRPAIYRSQMRCQHG